MWVLRGAAAALRVGLRLLRLRGEGQGRHRRGGSLEVGSALGGSSGCPFRTRSRARFDVASFCGSHVVEPIVGLSDSGGAKPTVSHKIWG